MQTLFYIISFLFLLFIIIVPYQVGLSNYDRMISTINVFGLSTDDEIAECLKLNNFENADIFEKFTFSDYYNSGIKSIINN